MFKIVVILCALVSYSESKPRKVKCPDYCDCDIFENLNRATCVNKKIVTIQIDMLPQVEILNLGFNQINELDHNVFKDMGLTNLKLLNLTHNKIGKLELYSFEGLSKLKTLDLSYNAIRYLMDSWFNSMSSLQELYLKGNNLRMFNEEARIKLKYLRVLDISSCEITSISNDAFEYTPNLKFLDISGNYLSTLNPRMLHPLKELKVLTVKDNSFDCKDKNMGKIKNYTMHNYITYEDPCFVPINQSKSMQFERMMVEPEPVEKNVWMFDDTDTNVSTVIQNDVKDCKLWNATNDSFLVELIMLSPWLSVFIIFITGLCLGLILGCAIEIIPKPRNERPRDVTDGSVSTSSFTTLPPYRERSNTLSRSMSRLSRSISVKKQPGGDTEELMMSQYDLSDSTPMAQRRNYNRDSSHVPIYANVQYS